MVCWQNTSLTGAASCVSSHESRRVLTSCTPLLTLHHTKGFIPLSCDTKQLGKHTIRIKTFSSNIIGVTLRSRSRSITYLCSACLNYSKTTPRLLLSDKFDFWVDSGWKTQKKKKKSYVRFLIKPEVIDLFSWFSLPNKGLQIATSYPNLNKIRQT